MKYNVSIYFRGTVSMEIEEESETAAKKIALADFENADEREIVSGIEDYYVSSCWEEDEEGE